MAINSKNLIGGGLGVNSVKEINSPDDLYISPKGKEWLKTGVLETDVASYPDASQSINITDPWVQSTSWTVQPEGIPQTGLSGMCADDEGFLWIAERSTFTVKKFTTSGVYTGVSFSVIAEISQFFYGVGFYDNHFWALNRTTVKVYKYTKEGVYTGVSFFLGSSSNTNGITCSPKGIWISKQSAQFGTMNLYGYDGTDTGVTRDSLDTASTSGVYFGGRLFVCGTTDNVLISLREEGTAPPDQEVAIPAAISMVGAAIVGDDIWVCDSNTKKVYLVAATKYVGIPTPSTGVAGLPNFTRIK